MAARFYDWLLLTALACWLSLGLLRILVLHARGVRVVASDRERTPAQMGVDLLGAACLFTWWLELVAYAWPLPVHIVPPAAGVVLFDAVALRVIGGAAWVAGLVTYGLALWTMGDSWRIGIDRRTPGRLVTDGIFTWSRNPIYVAFELGVIGTFLIQGRLIFLLIALVLAGVFHAMIRREERFLDRIFGDTFRQYRARTGRYVTLQRPRPGAR